MILQNIFAFPVEQNHERRISFRNRKHRKKKAFEKHNTLESNRCNLVILEKFIQVDLFVSFEGILD